MAQLFQPTNITPDIRGAFGNGVVTIDGAASFLEDVCTVSWQVNGNTPMTAFKIDFTDMDGNALYSTGKLTRGCPFYGTNQSGNISLFSYNIIQDDISTSFLRRASEGLMRITQWWGNGENDFIVQLSPSHYIVRQPLVAHWTRDGGSPTTSRNASFTGSFTGAETDGLMWIRWVLESITYESGRITSRQTVKDTGRLYGSVNPVFSYDGFLPGDYWLTLSGETSAGVVSELGEDIIHVVYDLSDVGVPVTASRDCNGESAVSVSWPRLQNIPLVDGGTGVSDNGRQISLSGDDSFLKWNVVNEEAMNFSAPWSAIWCGTVSTSSYKLFEIETTTAKYTSYVTTTNNGNGVLMVNIVGVPGGPPLRPQTLLYLTNWVDGPFMCIITPTAVYWKCMAASGGQVYPRETLYPSNVLYPGYYGVVKSVVASQNIPESVTQGNVTSVSLYGPSAVDYFLILDYGLTSEEATEYLDRKSVV